MLMKKILNFLLNVKHTVIDDVKSFFEETGKASEIKALEFPRGHIRDQREDDHV